MISSLVSGRACVLLAAAALLSLALGARPAAAQVVVPVSLDGTWRWIEWNPRTSYGVRTPASSRYERFLILREDDTHEYWGRDSTGTYRITAGKARVREMAEVSENAPRGAFLLEIENWNLQVGARYGPDTLMLSPAGEPGTPQPIRRYVRMKEQPFVAPGGPIPRIRSLRLPPGVTYQEVEGQPDFYDAPPFPTFLQPASYPEFARDAGIAGTVLLHVLVGSDGSVLNSRIVGRLVGLDQAAVEAVRKATFTPAKLDGRPVAAWTAMSFTFTLP
jgi:TonB family protein